MLLKGKTFSSDVAERQDIYFWTTKKSLYTIWNGNMCQLVLQMGGKSEEHVCNHQQEWGDEPTIDEP